MTETHARALADDVVEKPGEAWVAETPLRAGAIGLTGAVMQNVTHIAPAIAAFFSSGSLSCSPSACVSFSSRSAFHLRVATSHM